MALIESAESATRWIALWTHSHSEQLVHDQIAAKGFHAFLPLMPVWSRRGGVRHLIRKPMFPGYLFVNLVPSKAGFIEILKTNGLAKMLGQGWDRPAVVADAEIEAIRQVLDSGLPLLQYPYLREGHRVRISHGPLAGIEGLLIRQEPHKGLLVVSVDLLQRSVAVEVDCVDVTPLGAPVAPIRRQASAGAGSCAGWR